MKIKPNASIGFDYPGLISLSISPGVVLALLALILSLQNAVTTLYVPTQYHSLSAALIAAGNLNREQKAVEIIVANGVYRESIGWNPQTSAPLTIRAANRRMAIVSGSEEASWTKVNSDTYTFPWVHNWGPSSIPANWPSNLGQLSRQREIVWVTPSGEFVPIRLTQTLDCTAIPLEHYCVNESANIITFRTTLVVHRVEAAVRSTIFAVTNASNVTIDGMVFQHSAVDLQNNAVSFTKVSNSYVVNSSFIQNNGTGLGVSYSSNVKTEANQFDENGFIGYASTRSDYISSVNDIANRNNWRGNLTGFVDWSNGGLKWLFQRNAYVFGLAAISNYSHGLWLDFDNQNVLVERVTLTDNLKYGIFLEASTGPITIRNSTIRNSERCIFIGNAINILIDTVTCTNNRNHGILIGGDQRRAVKDRNTGETYQVPPSQYLTLQNVNISGNAPAFRHGTWDWPVLQQSLRVFGGSYTRTDGLPIEINNTSMTASQWLNSLPPLPEPSPMPPLGTAVIPTITLSVTPEATLEPTQTFTPIVTETPQPIVTTLAPTETVVIEPTKPTQDAIEIIIDVVVTGVLRIEP
jgi:hypothetical protein